MIVTYRRRRMLVPTKLAAQPAAISGSMVVGARKPKRYQRTLVELADDPEAQDSVRRFYERMGLGAIYQRAIGSPD